MKRLRFLCVCLLLLALGVEHGLADTADEVFENFKAAYEKSQNFSADFEETTLRAGNKSVAKGRLMFSKPNLLRKEYVSPKNPEKLSQLIVLDGEYSWSYTPLLNQVNKMKWNRSHRKELLPGIGASLEDTQKNYDMRLVEDEVANAKGIYHIELIPKPHMVPKPEDGTPPAREVLEVWVESKEWLPLQFGYRSESPEGETVSVIVAMTNIQRDQPMSPDTFKFNVPKGAEVIDLSSN